MLTQQEATINEANSFKYTATLADEDGNPITLASIVSATLDLYDDETLEVINNRAQQDILNANDVTIDPTSGLLTWDALAADTPIVADNVVAGDTEPHTALFRIEYNSSADHLNHELHLHIVQLPKVPGTP